ncbi:hypothetical protein EV659_11613 [Rhodothalassium salexigens DSM 2132]|uniref:Uncharacterized protein n=1 Tax=Rhodothalassium salexigens DSM 2132 TaxID=1188247 RepID=A0A4R2P723_RHOSA|nr:hypothetical protein [Rhodothalassium salexigens]MBB4212760.1 hypothetical protein [Rhodothalassium salexigens DSM 2132]TCP30048.1 hypothetical protein EV659_11613 [Rhodothalassium salexigens DSM 2132]
MTTAYHVRHAVCARLRDADPDRYPTLPRARVYPNRVRPLAVEALPAVGVYTLGETPQGEGDGGLFADHWRVRLALSVEVFGAGAEADDALDYLVAQVLALFRADPSLGGLVEDMTWIETEVGLDGDADRPVLATGLTFEVRYVQARDAAPALLSDLRVNVGAPFGPDAIDDYRQLG